MIFHTFLFVVAVLLSYVRNGFGIIPVMLDYCAVFKIRFAIVFCPNRLKAVSVAVRNPLSFRICDASGFRAAFAGVPGDARVRGSRLTVMLPRFPILCCGRFHPCGRCRAGLIPKGLFPR